MVTALRLGGFIEAPVQGDAGMGEAQAGEVRAMDPPASIQLHLRKTHDQLWLHARRDR